MKTIPQVHQLNELARSMVGDGQSPEVFFVSVLGNVVMATTDPHAAYSCWRGYPNAETSLESRKFGVICDCTYNKEEGCWESTDDFHLVVRV